MIVADANIVTYLLIEGPFTKSARAAYEIDPNWQLPSLWRYEFANALVVLIRAGELALPQAEKQLARGLVIFSKHEKDISHSTALRLAIRHRLSAYDAHYIALAEASGVPCVTEDRLLLERAPRTAINLAAFLEIHRR